MHNKNIQAQQIQNAYAQYCHDFGADLVYALNTERVFESYDSLSKKVSKLFYKLECDEFTYKKRQRYNKACRIERIVAIEQKSRFHAHVIVKRFGSHSDDMLSMKIALAWHDVNCATPGKTKQYLINTHDNTIRSNFDVCSYNTKDIAYEITRHNDVIDFDSSFIR
jgi:zona occludens toxin (predicted ATPase)